MFIPFFQPSMDDEVEEEGKKKAKKKAAFIPTTRAVTSNISLKLKVSRESRSVVSMIQYGFTPFLSGEVIAHL